MSADPDVVEDARSRWLGVAGWAILIFVAAAVPLPAGEPPRFGLLGPDKLLHLVAHAGFAGSLVAALAEERGPGAGVVVAAVGVSIAYGVGIEYLQEAIPGRGFEFADIVADALGSVVGALVWRYRVRRIE